MAPALYRDVLHSLFSFLTFDDLTRGASLVAREWHAASVSLPPLQADLRIRKCQLANLLQSPLRKHVTKLNIDENEGLDGSELRTEEQEKDEREFHALLCAGNSSDDDGDESSATDTQLLAAHMPHLRELTIDLDLAESLASLRLPRDLTVLWILFNSRNNWWAPTDLLGDVIQRIVAQAPQLTSASFDSDLIGDYDGMSALVSAKFPLKGVRALVGLSKLTSLRIAGKIEKAGCELIRSMRSLRRLELTHSEDRGQLESSRLDWLSLGLEPLPHLEELVTGRNFAIYGTISTMLSRLPSLTTLEAELVSDPRPLLLALNRLTNLDLRCTYDVEVEYLVSALCKHGGRLRTLRLYHGLITDSHLLEFVPHLTSLVSLAIKSYPGAQIKVRSLDQLRRRLCAAAGDETSCPPGLTHFVMKT